jgi:hypothetical protein
LVKGSRAVGMDSIVLAISHDDANHQTLRHH